MSNILAEMVNEIPVANIIHTTPDLTDMASVLFQSFLTQRNFPMT